LVIVACLCGQAFAAEVCSEGSCVPGSENSPLSFQSLRDETSLLQAGKARVATSHVRANASTSGGSEEAISLHQPFHNFVLPGSDNSKYDIGPLDGNSYCGCHQCLETVSSSEIEACPYEGVRGATGQDLGKCSHSWVKSEYYCTDPNAFCAKGGRASEAKCRCNDGYCADRDGSKCVKKNPRQQRVPDTCFKAKKDSWEVCEESDDPNDDTMTDCYLVKCCAGESGEICSRTFSCMDKAGSGPWQTAYHADKYGEDDW